MNITRFLKNIHLILITLLTIGLTSCLPEQQVRQQVPVSNEGVSTPNNNTDSTDSTTETMLNEPVNFLQLGSEKSTATMSIFADYGDSFLIRGNQIISFLKEAVKSSQTNYCMVAEFQGATGTNAKNIAILSARIRSYFNSSLQKTEYFLQVEPNNDTINQQDCVTVALTTALSNKYSTTNFAYKTKDVCPECNVNIASQSLLIYSPFGVEVNGLDINHLYLSLIPALGSVTETSPSCSINANCTSIGFNCCLSGQCVNHGEVKAGVSKTSDKYLQAINILANRPELIKDFQDIFYVCPTMVPTNPGNNQDGDLDPIQEANDLFTELTNLYNCLNPVIDEFSVCTQEYKDASNLMKTSAYAFGAKNDDLTFSSLNSGLSSNNNIVQIDYAGFTLFKEKLFSTDEAVSLNASIGSLGGTNDSLTVAQTATIKAPLPANAVNDIVSIYYKVDGTCEKLGTTLARCKKFYKQGQTSTPPRSSDHNSGNQVFALPSYVNTSFNVIVNVGGSPVPQGSDTWTLTGNNVVFDAVKFPIFNNQEIEITYFVTSNVNELTASKVAAQTKLNDHCSCDPNKAPCNLKPVTSEVGGIQKVTSYICSYPDPDVPDAPLQETVYVSAKSVPHKFYDVNGVNYDLGNVSSEDGQEGTKFEYTDGNNLKPNNISTDIGFNEIYGSMNIDAASPLPPSVVNVEKGTTYDLFVDSGAFSSCLNCGSDYFSSMQKIFPNNFEYKGGGYLPDIVESRRRSNQGDYRADDLRFGRACFVPASMIPWTHQTNSDVTTQRRNRLAAQHFLFANGYNKDWYGFDYGALIGSFDGIKWFAIGNQRRIKADSNKLYLAVNAYFGDLTINNTFKVMINEMNAVLNSGSFVAHDSDSDGAQCQRSHFCEQDNDCIAQLGYDYSCQNISTFTTPWPQFDTNGNEVSGSQSRYLISLFGGSNGQVKRCVYRGQGAICEKRFQSVNAGDSYTQSALAAPHSCSNNSFCADLTTTNFNTKISRFADSPSNQNIQSFIPTKTDTFGLAARNLGRPYVYYGNKSAPALVQNQLKANKVNSLCVPGKDTVGSVNIEDSNFTNTGATKEADKITNVGRTMASTTVQDENYFAFCPATNDDGNYTHNLATALNGNDHKPFAIRNNMSSNSLNLPVFSSLNFFNDDENPVTSLGYHKNTCLRAPGSSCFSDFECSPNSFISAKIKGLSGMNGEISAAEEAFWEEELVCGNTQQRYQTNSIYPNPLYDTTTHKCCRETSKSFTYDSQPHEGSSFSVVDNSGNPLIPGVNQDINDPKRYSRTHTVYDKLITDPTNYPSLVSAAPRPASPLAMTLNSIKQYNTLHLHNSRMCCTGNWVRSFAKGSNGNGGGYKHQATTQQNIPIDTFKTLSWNPNNVPQINSFPTPYDPTALAYTCTPDDIQTSDCEIKNLTEGSTEEEKYLTWFGKFELLGIPQVLIETNDDIFRPLGDTSIDATETNQQDISASKKVLPNTIKDVNNGGVVDATLSGKNYYSAASYENFEIGSGKLKKIFSENEFNCCIPTGVEIPQGTADSQCCTGQAADIDGQTRCCLNDFTDLSVYTNRYVSSEGATLNGTKIDDADIDAKTGYIKKEVVLQFAASMCCSGQARFGSVINNYLVPVDFTQQFQGTTTRRWLYLEDLDNAEEAAGGVSKYNAGLKWNDHVYCVPADFNDQGGGSGSGSGVTQE